MATVRIQLRRGTAAEWTAVDPVLAPGEMGLETDTGDFKFGDGNTAWSDLSYALGDSVDDYIPLSEKGVADGVATLDSSGHIPMAQLANLIDGAPAALNTLAELSSALNNDQDFSATVANALANKAPLAGPTFTGTVVLPESTSIGNISSTEISYLDGVTSSIQSQIGSVTSDLGDHESQTMAVHGITNTANLVYTDDPRLSDERITPDSAVTTEKIAASAVTTLKIADSNVTTDKIAEDAVTTAKIADLNVTTGKIADLAVESAKINDAAVTTQKIADSNVTTDKIADLNVTEAKINTGAVTELKIADGAVTSAKIANGTIVNADISNAANIEQSKIAGLVDDLLSRLKIVDFNSHENATTSVHGIADTSLLATTANVSSAQTAAQNYADSAVSTHNSDTTSVHGISDTSQLAYKNAANQTFTGNMEVDGNLVVDGDLTVNGTNFSASATSIVIEDNMVQLAHQNAANTVDLGLVVAYNDGSNKHSGIVRDVSADKWKLFKGVTTEPSTTVDFTQGSLDDLQVKNLDAVAITATGAITASSSGVVFADGAQTKQGVPSITEISQKTSNYTLSSLTERDTLIEVNHTGGSAVTITVPADSTVNFPVGTSIDILRTNTGEVTIAGSGATVNATPGLKLRSQWSSATLFKRAANSWVLFGDLKA